jgi:ubiquinone biosynthesis protein Coq4
MPRTEMQTELETRVANFANVASTASEIEDVTRRAKAGDTDAATSVVAAILRVATIDPGASMAVLDAITRGWLGTEASAIQTPPAQSAMLKALAAPGNLDADFWTPFWNFITSSGSGERSGDEVTAMVAALSGNLHEGFSDLAEAAAIAHPGAANAATRATPPKLTLESLKALPVGSLGHDFYRLISDNNFNLEVLDREAAGLQDMPPAQRYLNLRILQMHDVWHLVGGFRTTILQEVAISAFSLAQFGHTYSAMLIGTAATASLFNSIEAFGLSMQIISEGWLHGRTTPSFMAIEWENEWHLPISEIRARHGIKPFSSIFPADLIEQMRDAA